MPEKWKNKMLKQHKLYIRIQKNPQVFTWGFFYEDELLTFLYYFCNIRINKNEVLLFINQDQKKSTTK